MAKQPSAAGVASNPAILRRLAVIKHLFTIADRQSREPEPICSLAVLSFHDSVELFLELAAEHLNTGKSDLGFMVYWSALAPALSHKNWQLTREQAMRRLNKSRVDFKHSGIMPSRTDIESYRVLVESFFEENTSPIFGVAFSAISLVEAVAFPRTRDYLLKAETLSAKGDQRGSLTYSSAAFEALIIEHAKKKGSERRLFDEKLSNLGRSLPILVKGQPELERVSSAAREAFREVSQIISVLGLGLDFGRYSKFRSKAPQIYLEEDFSLVRYKPLLVSSKASPKYKKDAKFCLDFVTEASLALQGD